VSGRAAQGGARVQASGPKGPVYGCTIMSDLKVRPPVSLDERWCAWKGPRAPAESAGRLGLQSLRKADSSSPVAPQNDTNLLFVGSWAK
jgi:hypothetical protein